MTTIEKPDLIDYEVLRRALGLPAEHRYIWDGRELDGPCEHCGRTAQLQPPPPLPPGEPVVDVVPDPRLPRRAAHLVALTLQVIDRRRPERHIADRVHPRVLRYVRFLAADAATAVGGARLISSRAMQPYEGALELAASVRLRGRAGRSPPPSS